jgi:hypothetical protein
MINISRNFKRKLLLSVVISFFAKEICMGDVYADFNALPFSAASANTNPSANAVSAATASAVTAPSVAPSGGDAIANTSANAVNAATASAVTSASANASTVTCPSVLPFSCYPSTSSTTGLSTNFANTQNSVGPNPIQCCPDAKKLSDFLDKCSKANYMYFSDEYNIASQSPGYAGGMCKGSGNTSQDQASSGGSSASDSSGSGALQSNPTSASITCGSASVAGQAPNQTNTLSQTFKLGKNGCPLAGTLADFIKKCNAKFTTNFSSYDPNSILTQADGGGPCPGSDGTVGNPLPAIAAKCAAGTSFLACSQPGGEGNNPVFESNVPYLSWCIPTKEKCPDMPQLKEALYKCLQMGFTGISGLSHMGAYCEKIGKFVTSALQSPESPDVIPSSCPKTIPALCITSASSSSGNLTSGGTGKLLSIPVSSGTPSTGCCPSVADAKNIYNQCKTLFHAKFGNQVFGSENSQLQIPAEIFNHCPSKVVSTLQQQAVVPKQPGVFAQMFSESSILSLVEWVVGIPVATYIFSKIAEVTGISKRLGELAAGVKHKFGYDTDEDKAQKALADERNADIKNAQREALSKKASARKKANNGGDDAEEKYKTKIDEINRTHNAKVREINDRYKRNGGKFKDKLQDKEQRLMSAKDNKARSLAIDEKKSQLQELNEKFNKLETRDKINPETLERMQSGEFEDDDIGDALKALERI